MNIQVSETQLSMIAEKYKELGEQSDGTGTSSTTAGANKWESGVSRGPANQIGVTKWSEIVGSRITRGRANPLM